MAVIAPPTPAVRERHLDAVQVLKNDKLVLAASNPKGHYWNGSIFWFDSIRDAPNIDKCVASIETSYGISDMRCLDEDKVIVALDSGALEMHKMVEGKTPHFRKLFHSCEHDDMITSVALNCNNAKLISSGYDKCIKVWDLRSFMPIASYKPIHSGIVCHVSCSSSSPDLFISCGQDRKVLLHDIRLSKPVIRSKLSHTTPTALSWKPLSEAYAVGYDHGSIALQDFRHPGASLLVTSHSKRIHRLCFSHNANLLASCADDTSVLVTDVGNSCGKIVYLNDGHNDIVRGLSWTSHNDLVSCGWDKKVIKHAFNATEIDVGIGSICTGSDATNNSV